MRSQASIWRTAFLLLVLAIAVAAFWKPAQTPTLANDRPVSQTSKDTSRQGDRHPDQPSDLTLDPQTQKAKDLPAQKPPIMYKDNVSPPSTSAPSVVVINVNVPFFLQRLLQGQTATQTQTPTQSQHQQGCPCQSSPGGPVLPSSQLPTPTKVYPSDQAPPPPWAKP